MPSKSFDASKTVVCDGWFHE